MRILIAEDDLVSRNFLHRVLGEYGDCDLVVNGLEALEAFLLALKDKEPYQLICLDIMMPKADGVKTLKGIRDLERQYDIPPEKRAKIIMITALAEADLVQRAFAHGCEAYATKPIDVKKLTGVLEKLGLIGNEGDIEGGDPAEDGDGYFRGVRVLPDYQLEVVMGTGTTIHFDFRSRLNTARFGRLKDEELFQSAQTDGNYLIFAKAGKMPVKITAAEFMDLVLIDRREQG